ncbi:MAG: hypothetical protein ABI637_02970 [Gemmatimonadota bacterium]
MAIVAYFVLGMGRSAPDARVLFTGVWMAATLLAVLVGLSRIRRARLAARRPR